MKGIQHTKNFGVYHWDTFDNETFLITKNYSTDEKAEFDTIEEAEACVKEIYAGHISDNGADQVDIVNLNGDIVKKFRVK